MEKLFKYIHKIIIQLFVLVFLGIGNGANAQYPYDFSFAGIPFATKTIVRHYDNERVVVYYEENGNGYVSLVNVISNDAYTVPLNTGYFMNDMCILNDSVFLCGYETDIYAGSNYKIGTIVTMYLNNFYTTNVHVTYFEPSYWMNVDLKRIKQYEYTYATSNRAKLLLVGDIYYPCDGSTQFPIYNFTHTYVDENNHSMCMVNAVWEVSYPFYTSFSSAGPLQKVIRVMNPFEHSEVIHDVVVTDNYVAFVGVASGTIDTITLHICSKDSDVLKSDYTSNPPTLVSDFDNYYTYSLGTGSGSPFYHACALDGDMIAIVTQDEMSTSSTDITIRTFDLTTHTMTNTQYLQCYSHPELKDVAYNHLLGRIVLLYNGYFKLVGGFRDIFCTVDPYNSSASYTMPGITDNVLQAKFGSLDAIEGKYFITTGGKYGFAADASSLGPGSICYDAEDYTIVKRNVINAGTASFDYDIHFPISAKFLVDTLPVHVEIPSICIELLK